MKIALVISRCSPHGDRNRDFLALAGELSRRGHEVTIFCHRWSDEAHPEGCRIRTMHVGHRFARSRHREFVEALERELAVYSPDCTVSFSRVPCADIYYASENPASARYRRRYGWLRWLLPRFRQVRRLERTVYAPDAKPQIFCVASGQKRAIIREFGSSESRFTVLPPGVAPEFRRPEDADAVREELRRSLHIPDDVTVLLALGSGFYANGVDRAIQALASLPLEIMTRCLLVVCGHGSDAQMKKLADRLHVGELVRFLPSGSDRRDLFLTADLLLHPGRNASTDTVALAALSCGLPVIASGNYSFADEVREAGSEVLAEPFRNRDFNRALRLVLSTPGRLEKMTREAVACGGTAFPGRRIEKMAELIGSFRR